MQRWYKVYDFAKHGSEPQRINTARSIDIDGKHLCLTRTEEGYFALEDRCPHAGARFGMGGYCEDMQLVCPVHRYRYNVKTGQGKQGDYVQSYATETREDGVYVAIEKKWWQLF
jgi:3-phenylpropionate/trans-cinnamate dioxygenase ferredoxin subunit